MQQQQIISDYFFLCRVGLAAFSRYATVTLKKDLNLCSATWLLLCLLGCVHGLSPVNVQTRDGMGDNFTKRNTYTYFSKIVIHSKFHLLLLM